MARNSCFAILVCMCVNCGNSEGNGRTVTACLGCGDPIGTAIGGSSSAGGSAQNQTGGTTGYGGASTASEDAGPGIAESSADAYVESETGIQPGTGGTPGQIGSGGSVATIAGGAPMMNPDGSGPIITCADGATLCGSVCRDLQTDVNACGDCATTCLTGSMCTRGVCGCPGVRPGTCSEHCVDFASDPQNCGACGTACPWGCANGACTTPTDISLGKDFGCIVDSGHRAQCWGAGSDGQLGNGTKSSSVRPFLVRLDNVVQAAAGVAHVCVLLADGSVQCWGNNTGGQVGNGTQTQFAPEYAPVQAKLPGLATQITSGTGHVCALLADKTVSCWGANHSGQVGNGTSGATDSAASLVLTPAPVVLSDGSGPLSNVIQVTAGWSHTCALRSDNVPFCWGNNEHAQLALHPNDLTPLGAVAIPISNAIAISTGVDAQHTCVILDDGAVQCWGFGAFGQLGNGVAAEYAIDPVTVLGLSDVQSLAIGGNHSCAVRSDTTVSCWGGNEFGQIGDGTNSYASHPAPSSVVGLTNATRVSAGVNQTCAILNDDTVKCWGYLLQKYSDWFKTSTPMDLITLPL